MRSKNGQYFKKDKKVKLIRKDSSRTDSMGFPITVYKYITNQSLWAYATQLSQEQVFAAASYGEDETRLFVLNYRNDLQLYDIVEYKGKYYSITRLDTTDDYNGELFIYAKDTPRGDTPSNIQPADDTPPATT